MPIKYNRIEYPQGLVRLTVKLDSQTNTGPNRYYIANQEGKLLSKEQYTHFDTLSSYFIRTRMKSANFGVIDITGKVILQNNFASIDYIRNYNFFVGRSHDDGLYRIYDREGKIIGKNAYRDLDYLGNGAVLVCKDVEQKDGKVQELRGIVNIKNDSEVIFPFVNNCYDLEYLNSYKYFRKAESLEDGSKLHGVVSIENEMIIPNNYEAIIPLREGYFVVRSGQNFGVINKENKVIIPFQKQEIKRFVKRKEIQVYNLFLLKGRSADQGNYTQIANLSGLVNENKYRSVYDFNEDGQAVVIGIDNKRGIIDTLGKMILPMGKYALDEIGNGSVGDFRTVAKRINGVLKHGVLDKTGKLIIPLEYDKNIIFREGTSVVEKNGKSGLINVQNEILIPFEYDNISEIQDTETRNQLFIVEKAVSKVIFSNRGEMLTSPDKNISVVLSKIGWCAVSLNKKIIGYYNPNFEYITLH